MGRRRDPTTVKLFEQGLLKCCVCDEIKSLDEFTNNAGNWHGKVTRCKPCDSTRNNKVSAIKRAEFNVIKEAQGCMRCGYNEDGSKLHFHHRDPSTKLFDIGTGVAYSPQRVQEEIDKCDLLCSACHNIVEPRTGPNSRFTWDTKKI